MTSGSYYEKLAFIFEFFGYNVSHVIHFGRSCAPVLLEFAEVLTQAIEALGNWNTTVYNQSYSLNLPWEALRAAAGFRKEKGFYWIPRAHLDVPEELKNKVFPNIYRAKQCFLLLPREVQFRLPMARKFLRVMDHLAGVFVQDICQIRYEGRIVHQLYQDPFFQDPLFVEYEKKFIESYKVSSDPRNDPTLDPIKRAAPLMGHHLGDLKAFTYQGFNHIHRRMDNLHCQTQEMQNELKNALQQNYELTSRVANVVNAAVSAAYEANHDLAPQMPTIDANPSPQEQQEGMAVVPLLTNNTTNSEQLVVTMPDFDRLAYESLEQINDDWFGEGDSPYSEYGGIKSLYDNRDWRKIIGSNPIKREADKKMLQKMKRIGDFIDNLRGQGKSTNEAIAAIRVLLVNSPKTKETLTGIDKLLKKQNLPDNSMES